MVGGGSIIRFIEGENRIANDIDIDLIEFYKALQNNWLPPQHITEEDYQYYKKINQEGIHSPKVGFVKFFCSFGGKGWGGLARDKKSNRDFPKEAYEDSLRLIRGQYNDSVKLSEGIKNVQFHCLDYKELLKIVPINSLIYFDIPYVTTTEYKYKFSHKEYCEVIRNFSKFHDIYTSSYIAPEDFECVWSIERKTNLNMANGGKDIRIEKLFKFKEK
jgi:DNA adenine methylase